MAKKLTGFLKLGDIPKELIVTDASGVKGIWVDVIERKEPSKGGCTHTITIYNKEKKETIYLANLKPMEFGSPKGEVAPTTSVATGGVEDDDLPW